MTLKTCAIAPFGVEVMLDVAAGKSLGEAVRGELQALFLQHHLLVFRGLHLTMDEQIDLCRSFGPVPASAYENFYVSNTREDGFLGTRELQWHNDVPYLPSPYLVAALHAVEVDPDTTSTKFVDAAAAYARLPAALKARVQGLKALQVRQRLHDRANRLEDLEAGDLCTVHPVVRTQPETGQPYLFVNENMTAEIIGLSRDESDALLGEIYAGLYAESGVYDHAWQPGDMVIWDNLVVQHARGQVGSGARTLQRVTCTRHTYTEQYPADSVGEDLLNTTLLVGADS
ncbi:MAG: TauD/TfdA family dioxygenase [Novosphingobium sp.]|nr:MAG: TauD/TfdA family dioxygenase [Novosphingobium sp.]